MDEVAHSQLADQIAAAFDWWREAGVDADFGDAPQRWIAPVATTDAKESPVSRAASTPAPIPLTQPETINRSSWPQHFDEFAPWWLAEPWLDEGRTSARVPPRGVEGAKLMILVPEPERDDTDTLLAGPQGRLLNAMLAAMGVSPDQTYFASILARHTPHADWAELAARGLGEVARHHIALAVPQRLIVFGSTILPLLGHDLAQSPGIFADFQLGELKLPMLAARDLGVLLERPRSKAGFWQSWLDWTGTE